MFAFARLSTAILNVVLRDGVGHGETAASPVKLPGGAELARDLFFPIMAVISLAEIRKYRRSQGKLPQADLLTTRGIDLTAAACHPILARNSS